MLNSQKYGFCVSEENDASFCSEIFSVVTIQKTQRTIRTLPLPSASALGLFTGDCLSSDSLTTKYLPPLVTCTSFLHPVTVTVSHYVSARVPRYRMARCVQRQELVQGPAGTGDSPCGKEQQGPCSLSNYLELTWQFSLMWEARLGRCNPFCPRGSCDLCCASVVGISGGGEWTLVSFLLPKAIGRLVLALVKMNL